MCLSYKSFFTYWIQITGFTLLDKNPNKDFLITFKDYFLKKISTQFPLLLSTTHQKSPKTPMKVRTIFYVNIKHHNILTAMHTNVSRKIFLTPSHDWLDLLNSELSSFLWSCMYSFPSFAFLARMLARSSSLFLFSQSPHHNSFLNTISLTWFFFKSCVFRK